MNPNNGEVLAMASAPIFDLNNPRDLTVAGYTEDQLADMTDKEMSDALYTLWRNFCVNDSYEPGFNRQDYDGFLCAGSGTCRPERTILL